MEFEAPVQRGIAILGQSEVHSAFAAHLTVAGPIANLSFNVKDRLRGGGESHALRFQTAGRTVYENGLSRRWERIEIFHPVIWEPLGRMQGRHAGTPKLSFAEADRSVSPNWNITAADFKIKVYF
jgi:hypothetical protein